MAVPLFIALNASPHRHTYRAVGAAGAQVDPCRPPDTPSDHTRDSTGSLVGVVDTSLVVIALEVEGVDST